MTNIEKTLEIPLLHQRWKWVAIFSLASPVLWLALAYTKVIALSSFELKELVFACWSIAVAILNNIRLKIEDEMTRQMRLIAFQRGVFFLISGILAIVIMQFIRYGKLTENFISVFEALFLLMLYINITFQYLRWKQNQDEE